ncbi:MAG: DUF4097 family beta strand repeat-containing protein [Myxococcota bacterium]
MTACDGGRTVATIEHDLSVGELGELHLDQRSGDLAIHGEEGRESVLLVVKLRAHRLSTARDEDAKRSVRLGLSELGDGVGRILAGLDKPPVGYSLDVTAYVPSRVAMVIEDGSGDATITDIAALTIDDESGDLFIEDIAGGVYVSDDSGDLAIEGVLGDVDVSDGSGDIHIGGVEGSVEVRDASGDLHVASVDGDVQIDDKSGDIVARDVGGAVIVSDRSGDIVIKNAGEADILSDGSGDVVID